jgi:hypothetical protein
MVNTTEQLHNLGDQFDTLIDAQYSEFRKAQGPVGTHLRNVRGQIRTYLNDAAKFSVTVEDVLREANAWEQRIEIDGGFVCAHEQEPAEDSRTKLNHLFPEIKEFLQGFLRFKARTVLSGPAELLPTQPEGLQSHVIILSHEGISYEIKTRNRPAATGPLVSPAHT